MSAKNTLSDNTLFLAQWIFIGLVSLFDTHLLVQHSSSLPEMEQNPLGLYLLRIGGGDVSLFVICKLFGTVVVMSTLWRLRQSYPQIATPVVKSIAAFQAWLLFHLTIVTADAGYVSVIPAAFAVLFVVDACLRPLQWPQTSAT